MAISAPRSTSRERERRPIERGARRARLEKKWRRCKDFYEHVLHKSKEFVQLLVSSSLNEELIGRVWSEQLVCVIRQTVIRVVFLFRVGLAR